MIYVINIDSPVIVFSIGISIQVASRIVLLGDHPVHLLRSFALCTLENVVIRGRD